VVEVPAALSPEARAAAEQLAGALDDAAFPRRQAFREASRAEPADEAGPERQSG
jgi:hypothetical protein